MEGIISNISTIITTTNKLSYIYFTVLYHTIPYNLDSVVNRWYLWITDSTYSRMPTLLYLLYPMHPEPRNDDNPQKTHHYYTVASSTY